MTTTQSPLVFRIDEKLLQRRPPRLTLAATLTALCKQVQSRTLDANFVVEILNENQLLPYMINLHDNKNLFDASLGRNTNASKIGDLIVSEECIRGTYELCISFLEFILAIIRNARYRDVTKTMLASITYVANEIYTCQHIWTYKNIKDMNKILILCTEIFHQVLVDVKEPINGNQYSELEVVCLISLSQNQAHKQLLGVIVGGKNSITKTMEEQDIKDEKLLADIPIVKSIRQSLLIFNKLLTHSKYLKAYCDIEMLSPSNLTPNAYQHGASSAPMTNIEKAIFDTSIRPGLLQHLFSYVYRRNDSSTACLAADLIKNIAKKFSMSLMACLGSEADKVCEFFVECLSSKDTNVNLEVAILDLLSTCVKHQPGLIELFLNFQHKITTDGVSKELGSLEVVMNLLKECTTRQDDSYKLIHTYVMKFILTFWQKQLSAIEQFDKADNFWSLIMQPLVNFLESPQNNDATEASPNPTSIDKNSNTIQELTDQLNSYSLMILAREIFCLNAGMTERKVNQKLSTIMSDMSTKNLAGRYSLLIKKKYTNIPASTNKNGDCNRALLAWRDFLTSYSKYRPFEISTGVQNQIVRDLLACLTDELRSGEKLNKERIIAASETLLLVWVKWMPKIANTDDVFQSIHDLLYLADAIKDYLPFSFLLTFQSNLNLYLVRNRDYLVKSKRSFDLLEPSLQLMQFGLKIMERNLHQQSKSVEFHDKPNVESKLCLASIITLRFIIDVSRQDVDLWISYLQTNLKTDSLVEFFILLINKRAGPEICLSIVELLLCLSSIKETADYLSKAGLINQVNMIVVSTYERPYAHLSQLATLNKLAGKTDQLSQSSQQAPPMEVVSNNPISDSAKIYLDNLNSDHNWLPIYWHVIRLNISMMLTLNNDYMSTAVEFLSIHCIRVCEQLELLRTKPRSVNMEEALQIIYMINLILKHGCLWLKRNRQSYNAISEEIGKTAYTLATSALPPPTTTEQTSGQQQHTSIKPRDCLIYARCCYDFGKYTEAERVLFQTKFGDKSGFIREAAQIYGEELSLCAFHLAALICLKTNRQSDSIDFALQIFSEDSEYSDIVSALSQNRS